MSNVPVTLNQIIPGLAQTTGIGSGKPVPTGENDGVAFTELFSDLLQSVNQLHHDSGELQQAFLAGEPVEIHQVMIKAEQAGVATDLLLEIRNKLVEAYNEMMRMPV